MADITGMKINPPQNRLQGSLPKVGIRPTIDGRRQGVRESLEEQTMGMARPAAELITDNLRHACGLPVECVIADTCIGGVAEAAQAAEKFAREGVGLTLTVTPCWCYGAETMDMDPLTPKAIWGFNGTERPGAVYLAAVLAAHDQRACRLSAFTAAMCRTWTTTPSPAMSRKKSCASSGPAWRRPPCGANPISPWARVSMGIAGSIVDQGFFQEYLGMRNEYVDMTEFVRRDGRGHLRSGRICSARWPGPDSNCREGRDINKPEKQRTPRPERSGLGDGHQDGPDRPGPDDRQSAAGRDGLSARNRWATTPSPPVSKGSASGPTISPTATSSKPSSAPPSTGTGSASRSSWPRRTTA